MIRPNITILVVTCYVLKASQLALAAESIVQHVEDAVSPAISRGSISCVPTIRPGRLAEAQREISGFPESVPLPANQDALDWSKNIDPRITRLSELGREELNSVTTHLGQLDQYLQAQDEATTGVITRDPQTLVEPLIQVTPAHSSPRRLGRLVELFARRSSKKPELDEELREIIMTDVIPVWKDLQEKFINVACRSPEKEPEIKLNFLKSLFVLGDYFHKNKLVSPRTMERAEIFKPHVIVNLVDFYLQLLIQSKGNKLFESSEWVTPQIDLLIDNPSLSHFRRSIQALDHETQTYLVYRTLRSVLGKYQTLLPAIAIPPIDVNTRYFQPFLSTNLVKAGEDCLIAPYTVEDNGVYLQAFKDILDFFDQQDEFDENIYIDEHISRSQEQNQRFQVLLSYCILDFWYDYQGNIVHQCVSEPYVTATVSVCFEGKLPYLKNLLKLRQNGYRDSKQNSNVEKSIKTLTNAAHKSGSSLYGVRKLDNWIGTMKKLFEERQAI
ncbi:hypothetical protein KEM48_005947 [Puccinia striiformis f. sp. tritici PST-130]|uniref:Uncharacterized protein n=1 Tax=Puccinia striiformis f. sp. tritici PST-78 TaxID=1165861 RepID=A0A0L0VIT4_9BASI|nr:hypothetical protein KEM48_005947 [Puccinia striiformis f. sp. tritici PST-130]KNE99200.1 hypothetical protein PSTG_07508 [Puccinia striiformis f. sp. tritici PST-78]